MTSTSFPLVLTTVGTDHHPFTRLVRWVDDWVADFPSPVRCVIQSGTASPPNRAEWSAYLEHDELQATLDRASAVVSHGGPGTIIEARRRGIIPIVVPRRPELGEHVDDHQVRFSRLLASDGDILVCEREDELRRQLDRLALEPLAFRIDTSDDASSGEAVARFADLVGHLLEERIDGEAVA